MNLPFSPLFIGSNPATQIININPGLAIICFQSPIHRVKSCNIYFRFESSKSTVTFSPLFIGSNPATLSVLPE